ncbi:MAG: glycosyltransferase family protein [Parcubacteria group bacterium]|nr:glycosyltransferase family protein [Parcubacteria group bacterium]
MNKKVVAVIQARIGSTRLPRKVLSQILNRSLIEWIAYRLSFATEIDETVVSTVANQENDPIAELTRKIGLSVFRGSELDLVERLLGTARTFGAEAIVRITADCPFVDPDIIDQLVERYRSAPAAADLLTNVFPPTYPDGLDLEIIPIRTLERLDREIAEPLAREWVTANIMDQPEKFRIVNLSNENDLSHLRLTVDYPEDLKLANLVFKKLHREGQVFRLSDIVKLLDQEPTLLAVNRNRVDVTIVNKIRSQAFQEAKKHAKNQ